jgi:hypothetical protein
MMPGRVRYHMEMHLFIFLSVSICPPSPYHYRIPGEEDRPSTYMPNLLVRPAAVVLQDVVLV